MWLFYALLTVCLTTTLVITMRVLAVNSLDDRAFAFSYNLLGCLVMLTLVAIVGLGTIHLDGYLLLLMVLSGICYGLFQRYQFVVRKNLEASELMPVITPTVIVGYVLAIVWLHEPLTAARLAGFALLLAAMAMVVARHSKLRLSRYTLLAVAIGVVLAITSPLDRRVAPHFSQILTYGTMIWLFSAIITFLPYVKPAAVKKEVLHHGWRLFAIVGINIVATFTALAAIRMAPSSQVQPILSTNIVLVTILSVFVLKERDHLWLKFAAAVSMTVGLILISR